MSVDPEIVVALIVQAGVLGSALLSQNRKLRTIGEDAREARDQTANSHGTNLRDDLDRIEGKVDRTAADVRALHDDDAELGDTMSRGQVRASRALNRAIDDRNEQLDRMREEIPLIVRRQITQHVADCPLRAPQIGA